MKNYCMALLLALLAVGHAPARAQRVGLVMSGGGAKGLTHIGVIRALEESRIPIDYVAGTSMGAIIGSLYAMGWTPEEMKAVLSSAEFKNWYTGEVEPRYQYHFKRNRPTPEFFNLNFSLRDSTITHNIRIPLNMVSPIQMNIAFLKLYAGNTAACAGDFDRLFVPFRCVASDVYNKRPLIMRGGDLGDAVRASMTFPFVFRPIKVDGMLAYDGGIYNNFPTDVMQEDFSPDVIIGSVVANDAKMPQENDFMSQIENMIMQKTDYSVPDPERDVLLRFNYTDVNLLDFDRIDELERIGYEYTMQMVDSIRERVSREVPTADVARRRAAYAARVPDLFFRDVEITGGSGSQMDYIRREIRHSAGEVFTLEQFREAYFRLLTDKMISEIIPHATYDTASGLYRLHLQVKMNEHFTLKVGGNVATSNFNQIYLGLGFREMVGSHPMELLVDGQIGKIYNNAQVMARFDVPGRIPVSYRLVAAISQFDYYKDTNLFKDNNPTINSESERFVKAFVAMPLLTNRKIELGLGLGRMEDRYFPSNTISFDKGRYDHSVYHLFGGSVGFYANTLNARQYATRGYSSRLLGQAYTGDEHFRPGNATDDNKANLQNTAWVQVAYTLESYHPLTRHFTLGWHAEAVYSSKPFSHNYTATMMNAAAFTPTPHSQLVYNEAFRANRYVAAGVKPIWLLNDRFHLRTECYGFLPVNPIERDGQNKAHHGKAFHGFAYMGEVSLVCRLPFGSISAYVNHYSSPKREWNAGLSLGWQLYNYRFLE